MQSPPEILSRSNILVQNSRTQAPNIPKLQCSALLKKWNITTCQVRALCSMHRPIVRMSSKHYAETNLLGADLLQPISLSAYASRLLCYNRSVPFVFVGRVRQEVLWKIILMQVGKFIVIFLNNSHKISFTGISNR